MTVSGGAGLRIVIILLAFLVASQILIVGIGFFLRVRDLGEPTRPQIVNQVAAAVALLEDRNGEERAKALRAINSPFIRYSILSSFPYADVEPQALPRFSGIVEVYRMSMPNRPVRLIVRDRPATLAGRLWIPRRASAEELVFVIGLGDGTALVVEPSPEYRRQVFINFLALLSSLLGVALLIGLVLASFATARPLARLAANAEAFAANLDAPPFEDGKGPEPVRNLARAFNRMQTDIRRLVSERQTTLAAVAHDYRTYLTRLRLRAEFIDDAEQRAKTVADLDEMTALIDDTLFFAKADQARAAFEAVDLASLARAVVGGAQEAGGRATFAAEDAAFIVSVHPRSLKRALVNLVDNALKYGAAAHVSVSRQADFVTLIVEDEGPGVPAEKLSRLTEPFFRIENSRSRETGGAGLGLAIARMLVEASGGKLAFGAGASGGLRAEIALPAAAPQA